MSALSRAAMHIRVRRMFLEELGSGQPTDFIDETQVPDEIDQAWDEACAEFHQIVIDNAEQTGRLEDHDNKYLIRYLQRRKYNITVDQYEYGPMPGNIARIIKLEVDGLRGLRKSPADDRLIRTWPSTYGPGRFEVFWCVLAEGYQSPPLASDEARRLRIYVYGNTRQDLVPAVPLATAGIAELVFYRLMDPVAYNSPPVTYTDVEDPWADGPIHGTVARLQEKAQATEKAMYHYQMARARANLIVAPPQQAPQQ